MQKPRGVARNLEVEFFPTVLHCGLSGPQLFIRISEICKKLESGMMTILNVLGKQDIQNH